MDTAVQQSNKENSKPDPGPKKPESQNVTSKQKLARSAPLRSKTNPREENGQAETKARLKTSHAPNPTQKRTQTFHTQQTLRHRKLVLETQKPPSSVPPKPLLPGAYRGKVVQSKIDCFRKPPSGPEKDPSGIKPEGQTVFRSKSVTVVSASSGSDGRGNMQKTVPQKQTKAPARTDTVSTKPPTVSTKTSSKSTKPHTVSKTTKPPTVSTKTSSKSTKPPTVSSKTSTISSKPPTVSKTTKPPTVSTKTSTVSKTTKPPTVSKPSTVSSTISRKPVTMSAKPPPVTSFIKKKEPLKPAPAAGQQKPLKSITSSISQYRVRVESTEERQLKLAEWLASKGKTLKRPVMTEKSVPQTCRPPPCVLQLSGEADAEAANPIAADQSDVPQSKAPAFSSSPSHILNITLDLLENSDTEPAEPDIRMETLVMNLCERLEAMETPSTCESDVKEGGSGDSEVKVEEEEERPEYEILEEEELTALEKKDEGGEEEKRTFTLKEEDEKKPSESDGEEDEEEEMDSAPADVVEACVVKYSVKTTPFLQSVKKRMGSEMVSGTPGSRRKSSIKELRFLTPVRRSSRIHRNSSRLPDMLNEHDPCVSSLAELELLDAADSNAYIYRKNPALLLQHLPEHHPHSQSSQ